MGKAGKETPSLGHSFECPGGAAVPGKRRDPEEAEADGGALWAGQRPGG